MTARDLKLARERGRALPRHHPLYRRKLELPAEYTALAFGHRSLLENCPLFLCLILGVHSTSCQAGLHSVRRVDDPYTGRRWRNRNCTRKISAPTMTICRVEAAAVVGSPSNSSRLKM